MYPVEATQAMMNLIGSHDTVRFLNQSDGDTRRLMLAAVFQMTYVGVPQIYYGDEVALAGGKDPDNRRPFPWDWEQENERRTVHDWYEKLIHLRHAHQALRTGRFETALHEKQTYGYWRSDQTERFLVILHNDDAPGKVSLQELNGIKSSDWLFKNLFDDREWKVNAGETVLRLKPFEGLVLKVSNKKK
jgi:glycosidase